MPEQLTERGFYTLPGHSSTPSDTVAECLAGEALGLGSTFISERFSTKEAGVLSGAAGAITRHLGIATAATNHHTRHPLVTATLATTMHRLTGGRFALVQNFRGAFDAKADRSQLEHLATLLPDEWLAPAATGTAEQCAAEVARQFDLGVTGVIMHGATPDELQPVVEAYRKIRPAAVTGWPANPGRLT